jgi:hypothetical protein
VCGGGGEYHLFLKYSEIPSRRQELLKSKWPPINVGIALRKILSNMTLNREI